MNARQLQRTIFVACREMGLDSDARHDLQLRVTGKASLSDMDEPELRAVINDLKAKGFRLARGTRRPRARRADVRYCHVLWRLLHEAGAVHTPGAMGLNAFVRSRFEQAWGYTPIDIDAMQETSEISDVVEALKQWCDRVGVDPAP